MVQNNYLTNGLRLFVAIAVIALLALVMQAAATANAQVVAASQTAGFGAAFGYAQTIGSISYTQAGSIGNGVGFAAARTPGYYQHRYDPHYHSYRYYYVPGTYAYSGAATHGNAAAFSTALGTPFGSNAYVQTAAFNGFAAAIAGAN